jgi:hypothetical protein
MGGRAPRLVGAIADDQRRLDLEPRPGVIGQVDRDALAAALGRDRRLDRRRAVQ